MKVYRVEDDMGNGPYSLRKQNFAGYSTPPGYLAYECDQAANLPYAEHPDPCRERLSLTPARICGFKSLRQLDAWWKAPAREYLANHWFMLAIYNVPAYEVDIGVAQCTFPDYYAVEHRSLLEVSRKRLVFTLGIATKEKGLHHD